MKETLKSHGERNGRLGREGEGQDLRESVSLKGTGLVDQAKLLFLNVFHVVRSQGLGHKAALTGEFTDSSVI